jgi:hypothetical protein
MARRHGRRPQPARPLGAQAPGLHLRRHRAQLMARVVVTGGAGFLGSHLCDRCSTAATRSSPSTTSSPAASPTSSTSSAARLHVRRARRVHLHLGPGEVDAVLHFASPASPKDYLEMPIQTSRSAASAPTTPRPGQGQGGPLLPRLHQRGLRRPAGAPPARDLLGQREPGRPRGVYDEAKRFAEAMTMAYHRHHGLDVRIVRIFNTYGPACGPRTGGWCRTSSCRRCRASRSPSTATAARPAASATSTTRSRGSSPCSTPTTSRADQHRQPRRVHDARAGRAGARGHRLESRSSSSRCRSTTPTQRRPTSPRPPGSSRLGAEVELRDEQERVAPRRRAGRLRRRPCRSGARCPALPV